MKQEKKSLEGICFPRCTYSTTGRVCMNPHYGYFLCQVCRITNIQER